MALAAGLRERSGGSASTAALSDMLSTAAARRTERGASGVPLVLPLSSSSR